MKCPKCDREITMTFYPGPRPICLECGWNMMRREKGETRSVSFGNSVRRRQPDGR